MNTSFEPLDQALPELVHMLFLSYVSLYFLNFYSEHVLLL